MRFRLLKCLHLSVWGWGGPQQKGAQFARALVSSVCRSALSWILQGCVLWIGLSCAVVTERSFSTHCRPRTMPCVPGYFSNWVSHLATGGHTDATAGRVHSCARLLCALLWWRAARQAAVDSREIPVVQLGRERAFRKKNGCPVTFPRFTTPYRPLPTFRKVRVFDFWSQHHPVRSCLFAEWRGLTRIWISLTGCLVAIEQLLPDIITFLAAWLGSLQVGWDLAGVSIHCLVVTTSCNAFFPPREPWDSMGWAHPLVIELLY